MPLSADALWVISVTPVVLVGLIALACVVGGVWQAYHLPEIATRDADVDVAFWTRARADQLTRRATLGTPERPEPERINLLTATLTEALDYLRDAKARAERDRAEFLTLILTGGRTA